MQDIWLRTAEVKLNLELIQDSDPELVVSMFPTLPHLRTVNLQQGWPECYLVFYWAGLQDTPWLQWEFYEDKDLFQQTLWQLHSIAREPAAALTSPFSSPVLADHESYLPHN